MTQAIENQEIKAVKAAMQPIQEKIANLLADRKLLSKKNIDKPKKKEIDHKIQVIKDLEIKPLAEKLAKIRFSCPKRQEFIKFIDDLSKNNGGWSYISIDPYHNDYGEIARHTVAVNFDYGKEKEKDRQKLAANNNEKFVIKMTEKYPNFTEENFSKAMKSLINPVERKSVNVFKPLAKGIKYHIYTGQLYISGLYRQKTVMVEGEYPKTNSRPETVCKRLIEKELSLLPSKYKIYIFDFINSFRFDGETLKIEPIR